MITPPLSVQFSDDYADALKHLLESCLLALNSLKLCCPSGTSLSWLNTPLSGTAFLVKLCWPPATNADIQAERWHLLSYWPCPLAPTFLTSSLNFLDDQSISQYQHENFLDDMVTFSAYFLGNCCCNYPKLSSIWPHHFSELLKPWCYSSKFHFWTTSILK